MIRVNSSQQDALYNPMQIVIVYDCVIVYCFRKS